ncbi:hypothetical protein M378DRAFT_188433 [Amanita muscaria Koide BX008]|uniref:Uncharacterized protein n=1 Tax=Amanita muscaria (strain Koide BX008) TaxID=946122 RepID=A0A0C2WMM9_AMAMK|nr:hypothetical protein M378DRAFT_188433 [Amanita muscaria Koide BX008]
MTLPIQLYMGSACRDCVYISHNPTLPGFQGMHVAHVHLFLSLRYECIKYPCALVSWFSVVGDEPCDQTGMWIVTPDVDGRGNPLMNVVHVDSIVRGAHLIGIVGKDRVPLQVTFANSLDAFSAFYVNNYIDHHAHELVS